MEESRRTRLIELSGACQDFCAELFQNVIEQAQLKRLLKTSEPLSEVWANETLFEGMSVYELASKWELQSMCERQTYQRYLEDLLYFRTKQQWANRNQLLKMDEIYRLHIVGTRMAEQYTVPGSTFVFACLMVFFSGLVVPFGPFVLRSIYSNKDWHHWIFQDAHERPIPIRSEHNKLSKWLDIILRSYFFMVGGYSLVFAIKIVAYVMFIVSQYMTAETVWRAEGKIAVSGWEITALLLWLGLLFEEVGQLKKASSWRAYFENGWAYNDWLIHLALACSVASKIYLVSSNYRTIFELPYVFLEAYRGFLVCSLLLSTLAFLRWMNYWQSLGPLVSMFFHMLFSDLTRFLVIFCIVLIGFTLMMTVRL